MEHKMKGPSRQDFWTVWGILLFSAGISGLIIARTYFGLESVSPFLPGFAATMQLFSVISLVLFLRKGEPRSLWYTAFYQILSVVLTFWQMYQRPASFQTDFGTLRLMLGIGIPMAAAASLHFMAQRLSQEKVRSSESVSHGPEVDLGGQLS